MLRRGKVSRCRMPLSPAVLAAAMPAAAPTRSHARKHAVAAQQPGSVHLRAAFVGPTSYLPWCLATLQP